MRPTRAVLVVLVVLALTGAALATLCSSAPDPTGTSAATRDGSADSVAPATAPIDTTGTSPATALGTGAPLDDPSSSDTPSNGPPTTRPAGPGHEIYAVDFGELTLPPDACAQVFPTPPADGYELHDGWARHGNPADDDFYSLSVTGEPAFGDLTGDGHDDAVIVVSCSTGLTPISYAHVYTVVSARAEPERIGQLVVRDGSLVDLALEGQTIVTRWQVGTRAEPSERTVRYTWSGSTFVSS